MTTRLPRQLGPAALVAVLGLGLPLSGSRAPAQTHGDVAASAHATPARPEPQDARSTEVRLRAGGHARASATSSATCDGCDGLAATVQVVHVRPGGSVDNVAVAWSTCVGCSARSVALQVVLVTGPSRAGVALTNRALAVNAACTSCTSEAVAVQYVVVGGNGQPLSRRLRAELADLATRGTGDPAALREAPTRRGRPSPARVVAEALETEQGGTVELRVQQRSG